MALPAPTNHGVHYHTYVTKLNETIYSSGALGSVLVVGINAAGEEGEDSEDAQFTEEQCKKLRHILITKERATFLEDMQEILMGDTIIDASSLENIKIPQADQIKNIATSIEKELEKAKESKSSSEKFDRLFALTLTLKHFDHLLQETDDIPKAQEALDNLSIAWREVLALADEEIGIDSEITHNGIIAFLEVFADQIKSKFTFKHSESDVNRKTNPPDSEIQKFNDE